MLWEASDTEVCVPSVAAGSQVNHPCSPRDQKSNWAAETLASVSWEIVQPFTTPLLDSIQWWFQFWFQFWLLYWRTLLLCGTPQLNFINEGGIGLRRVLMHAAEALR